MKRTYQDGACEKKKKGWKFGAWMGSWKLAESKIVAALEGGERNKKTVMVENAWFICSWLS